MESRPASPGSASTASMARLDDSSTSSNSHGSKDSRHEPSHSSSPGLQQPEAVFESRGSLDTLAAAALKPLPEKYGQRHRLPQPQLDQEQEQGHQHQHQQQQPQDQIQQKQHSRLSSHAAHSHKSLESASGTARPSPSHDHNSRNSSTSSLPHPTPHSEELSSRFHYRDQRQHISDEDSEDDPLYRSRQVPHKEQEQRSSLTLRRSPDNSQTGKVTNETHLG
ncbi:hypothetical protein KVV02_000934 [Mortierella alpina]|uniref:Uncharacterized protein n=1 Tax=Mortierella alpina TaxID=64518 RepID=A0A9P8A6U9_MORAP|nr:hypothetical protein KVV02_000934 [Mortierella alpina]